MKQPMKHFLERSNADMLLVTATWHKSIVPNSAIEIEWLKSMRVDRHVKSKKSEGSVTINYEDYLNVTKSEKPSA